MTNTREEIFRFDKRSSLSRDDVICLAAVVRAAARCRRVVEIREDGNFSIILLAVVPVPKRIRDAIAEAIEA